MRTGLGGIKGLEPITADNKSDVDRRSDYEEGMADGRAGNGVPLIAKSDDWIRGYTAGKVERRLLEAPATN